MAELKTRPSEDDVTAYLATLPPERRTDCTELVQLMQEATGSPAVMWGTSMVGFGTYSYRYASGRAGEWFRVGFAARKNNLTLYIMNGFDGYDELLARLGPHSTGKACLYVKRLDTVDRDALAELVRRSVAATAPGEGG